VRRDSVEEAMGETPVSTEQPQTRQAPRVPAPDVDPGGASHRVGAPSQGPSAPVRLILPIRDRDTFIELRKSRRRVRRGPLTVTWSPGESGDPARLGYAIGRKTGNAVVRNRVRRRLRAAARECRAEFAPGAYLVGATAKAAALPYRELRSSLVEAVNALSAEPSVAGGSASKRPVGRVRMTG
jgi:ribonuclease P protein component